MKFDSQRVFNFPVLRNNNDDYIKGSFRINLEEIQNVEKNDDYAFIKFSFELDVKEIKDLLSQNLAEYCVILDSKKSFYRESFTFNKSENNSIKIKKELCKDKLILESYIVAKDRITGFKCSDINSEFNHNEFSFEQGAILAQNEEIDIDCINDRYKELTNLVQMNKDPNLKDGEWKYDIEADNPIISVSSKQYEIIHKNKKYRAIFANTFLVIIVNEMLDIIFNSDDESDDLIWKKWILEKLDNHYADTSLGKLDYHTKLQICQKILKNPLKSLNSDLKTIENLRG